MSKRRKLIIIILAVLLGLSIAVLAGTLIYNRFAETKPTSVTVPENIITPETDDTENKHSDTDKTDSEPGRTDNLGGTANTEGSDSTASGTTAKAMYLYDRNSGDTTPFNVENMFPGDKEIKYYCVKISYKDTVTVRFRAEVRPEYEKLAEVLKCRVVLLSTGETLYDGLMRDMPESVNHSLKTDTKATDELYYEITAYLDTSVGNEYMEKNLKADFKWWVEETGNLEPSPKTGGRSNMVLWICLASGSLLVLIVLVKKRRREDERYE